MGENGVAPHETCHERQLLAPPVTRGADRVMCSGWGFKDLLGAQCGAARHGTAFGGETP